MKVILEFNGAELDVLLRKLGHKGMIPYNAKERGDLVIQLVEDAVLADATDTEQRKQTQSQSQSQSQS